MSIERAAPNLCAAFRTTVNEGGEFRMEFRFPSMEAMHEADREWHALRTPPIEAGQPDPHEGHAAREGMIYNPELVEAGQRGKLIERLRRKVQVTPAIGGGAIGFEGEASCYTIDDGYRYANPDGPAAADTLTASASEIARLERVVGEAVELLRPLAAIGNRTTGLRVSPDSPWVACARAFLTRNQEGSEP